MIDITFFDYNGRNEPVTDFPIPKTKLTGNKGEWSEPYVALRLLGEGKIYLADDNGAKNPNEWMNVLDLMRRETQERIVKYHLKGACTDVVILINDDLKLTVPASDFLRAAGRLKAEIVKGAGHVFKVSDVLDAFIQGVEITRLSAAGQDKNDIYLNTYDPISKTYKTEIGFSIKSSFGQNPTLFNTAKASAVKYKLSGITEETAKFVNEICDVAGHVAVGERCAYLKENCGLEFVGFPIARRAGCEAFRENLELINPHLVKVIERMLWNHFMEGEYKNDITDVVARITRENPCGLTRPEEKYTFMVKQFLYDAYCGLTASTLWNGKSDVNGGFIKVDEKGEVLAYYAMESESFKKYLFDNCYLEFPSTDEKHGDYGKVYKEGNDYFFNLNFQIRYRI